MNRPTVQVLLSTYNGERYINEQIKSILSQKDVDVHLLIRDDGSKDKTVDIIEEYGSKRIQIIRESNVGCTRSFLKLLSFAGNYDYYAFSDQDDVWDEDKLAIGINRIKEYEVPAIYSSNTRLVDSNLQPLKTITRSAKADLGSAIIKNYVSGCTAIFNYKLMQLLKEYDPAEDIPFHDWWVNLVALANGGISVYDSVPHISYRQHDNNTVGAADSFLGIWKYRLNKFVENGYQRDAMARQLMRGYSATITNEAKSILEEIGNYKHNKLRIINDKRIRTNSMMDNILFFLLVLTNKI